MSEHLATINDRPPRDWDALYLNLLTDGIAVSRYFDNEFFDVLKARALADGLLALGWVEDAWDETSWVNLAMRDGSPFERDARLNSTREDEAYRAIPKTREDLVDEWGETLLQARDRLIAKIRGA
jgi:hypothetical protein